MYNKSIIKERIRETMQTTNAVLPSASAPKSKMAAGIRKYQDLILATLLSVLLARFRFPGELCPLMLPFVLACQGNIFVFAGAVLGMLSGTGSLSVKYGLMLLCGVLADKLIALTFPDLEKRSYRPWLTAAVTFLFGWIFLLFSHITPYQVLLVCFETFLSGVFYLICRRGLPVFRTLSGKRFFTHEDSTAAAVLAACAVAGMGNLTLPFDIYIKNILSILAVLLCSFFSNPGTASKAALLMGLATGISGENTGIFLSTYVLNGLCASVFSRYGKLTCVLGFTMGNVLTSLFLVEERLMVIGFHEIAIASILFVLIPDKLFDRLLKNVQALPAEQDKAGLIKDITAVKLDRLGLAFRRLSDTVLSAMNKTKPANLNDMGALFDAVADKVCKKCAMRSYCWQKDYSDTMDALFKAAKRLEETGSASAEDFPSYFTKKCVKAEEVLRSLTVLYEIYRVNLVWQSRMLEHTAIYREQFLEIADIVSKLKEEILQNPCFDTRLSLEISSRLEQAGVDVKAVHLLKNCNNCYEAEVRLYPCREETPCFETVASVLQECLQIPFFKEKGKCSGQECSLLFKECEIYSLHTCVRQSAKTPDEKNGDSYCSENLHNGNFFLALCDGSGSGNKANAYSSATIKLLEQFLKTGFSKAAAVKLIDSSLLMKTETDYFSTVDFCLVDLKNGSAEFMKKGAAPTYIRRKNGDCQVITADNLPAGILSGGKNPVNRLQLQEGDLIIMVSDGVCDAVNKEHWIVDALNAVSFSAPEDVSEVILKIAQSSSRPSDDMTVMAAQLIANS